MCKSHLRARLRSKHTNVGVKWYGLALFPLYNIISWTGRTYYKNDIKSSLRLTPQLVVLIKIICKYGGFSITERHVMGVTYG